MSVRSDKVASLVKQEVSSIFQRYFGMEEYGFLTVTEVRMSPDLKNAKVYVSVFGDAERKQRSMDLLEGQKSFIRAELGHSVNLKFTPALTFYLDESLDRAMLIENLLNRIHNEPNQSRDDDE
jgi:ribosome-binding factor A